MKVQTIPLAKIEQNENSRVVYKQGDLADLMGSMKKDGLLQPVGVKALSGGKFDAVFGNRRIAAARKLGWAEIPAHVMDLETDTDRDLINLIENIKRQNTSVSEDGRMFQILKDRGLTVQEIAVRLGVNPIRVETALEVIRNVPADIQRKIVNRTNGTKMPGTISASAAHEILQIRRLHRLTKGQTDKLFEFAQKDETSLPQIKHVAPLVKEGMKVEEAIKIAGALTRVTLAVFVDKRTLEKLEKKTGQTYTQLLWGQLEKNKDLGVERGINHQTTYKGTTSHRKDKLKTMARHSVER
jgi:ParB/RepB/Spo0J family partition protein